MYKNNIIRICFFGEATIAQNPANKWTGYEVDASR